MTLYNPKELIVNLNMKKAGIIIAVITVVLSAAASFTVFKIMKKKSAPKSPMITNKSAHVTQDEEEEEETFENGGEVFSVRIRDKADEEDIFEDKEHLRSKIFEISNYSDTSIVTSSPVINFRGTCSPFHPLTCNGKKIETADNGDFSIDVNLSGGINKITFGHKGKEYVYNVTYNINIIDSISPADNITVPSGMDIDIYATALSGSDVRVVFNGQTVRMGAAEDSDDEEYTAPAGFTAYKATLKAPSVSSETNTGQFKVIATNGGETRSKTGASIRVIPRQTVRIEKVRTTAPRRSQLKSTTAASPVTVTSRTRASAVTDTTAAAGSVSVPSTRIPHGKYSSQTTAPAPAGEDETDAQEEESRDSVRLQKYSYNSDYGLGSAEMIEMTDDYVEIYPGSNLSPLSSPEYSPQLKGTVDYITSRAAIDKDTYYFTFSGFKVPVTREENGTGGKTKITHFRIVSGYVMPSNNVKIVSCRTEGGNTVIKFDLNRKVPFNVKLTGQSYLDNGKGRKFKVSSPDFKGIQIKFFDTVSVTGSYDFTGALLGKGSGSVTADEAVINIPVISAKKFRGWHCYYDEQGYLTLTVYSKPSSLQGYTVMLDAGHGGYDGGASCAVSPSAWNEQKINLSIASKVKSLLESEGAKVIMTRSDGSFLSLTGRVQAARNHSPDIFISIHCDASSSAGSYGTSAYYYRAFSQPLADSIHKALVSCWKNNIYAGMNRTGVDRGAMFSAYRVTRIEECPSVLIEYGFVTNSAECQALESGINRDLLAKATVTGIKSYISQYS